MHRFKQTQSYHYKPEFYGSGYHGQSQPNSTNSQHLQYINLLDKCTQILREDRIQLRSQIKSGDEEVLHIFKSTKKPINMQNLQIRLRKYVTAVKSKSKMEQLMKFKENLIMGTTNSKVTNNKQCFNSTVKVKNSLQEQYYSHSQQPMLNSSSKQNRYSRDTCTVTKSPTYDNFRSHSSHNSHSLKKKFPSEEINMSNKFKDKRNNEYRNAQQKLQPYPHRNATSLQKSYFQNKNYPTIEQLSEREEMNSGRAFGVNNAIRKPKLESNLFAANLQVPNGHKPRNNQMFEGATSQHEGQRNGSERDDEQNNYGRDDKQKESQEQARYIRNKSKMDSSNRSQQKTKQQDKSSFCKSQNRFNFLTSQPSYIEHDSQYQETYNDCISSRLLQNKVKKNSAQILNADQPPIEINSLFGATNPTLNIPLSDQNNLFTSPELLNECRRFIQQQRSESEGKSSGAKRVESRHVSDKLKSETLKFNESQSNKKEIEQPRNTVNNNLLDSYQGKILISNKQLTSQQQDKSYAEKQRDYDTQDLSKHHYNSQVYDMEERQYQLFRKIAATSQQPKEDTKNNGSNTTQNNFVDKIDIEYQSREYSAQDLMDMILPQVIEKKIGQKDLLNALPREYTEQVKSRLSPHLKNSLLIVDVGTMLAELVRQRQQNQGIQIARNSNSAKDIYTLLDIDQKGYVTIEDIEGFLGQLQDAEIECLEDLSEKLWRIYEMSEIEDKVYYWVIYSLKDYPEFEDVCAMLEQFQFEIEM